METILDVPIRTRASEKPVPINASKPSLSPAESPRIVHTEADLVIATWDRHILAIWRRDITALGVVTWGRCLAELQKQHPGQRLNCVSYLEPECVVDGSSSTFQSSVDVLKRFEASVAALAMVYNREGFWSAAMRGRLTAIFNEANGNVPYALHATLPEALEWLEQHGASDIEVHPLALAKQVEALRKL